MATTTLRGIVKEIKPIEYYGEGNQGRKQTLVLFVPGYINSYGEKLGADELWGVDIYNKQIETHSLNSNCIDKKAEVEVYLRSREFERKDGAGVMYGVSATLKSIKLGETVLQSKDGDDTPF